jgi:hypothetical protein
MEIGEAQRLLEAAKGNIEAAKSLPGSLQAFIAVYLDDSQRKELAAQPVAEIVPHLHRFREIGAAELATYDPKTGRKIAFADLEKENSKVSATNSRAPS